jgi:anti-sigma regulatory factor (Ser/Thr protein kinase)
VGLAHGGRLPAVTRTAVRSDSAPPDQIHPARLGFLAEDAETIVGEFVANAVTHAAAVAGTPVPSQRRQAADGLGLRLLRRNGEVICAVLDPSDKAPVLKAPAAGEEAGRGLQMVDALSDVWGWSPVAGRGKAVWAVLFCA